MEIIELNEDYCDQAKDILVELQNYVIEIDKYSLNTISPDYRQKYFENLVKDCKENNGKILIATSENNLCGLIAGYIQKYTQDDKLDYTCPKKGIIAELIISKKHRASGVGQKLLDKMEEYFRLINCEYIQLDVFAYNEPAKRFYAKNNYEERMVTLFKKI